MQDSTEQSSKLDSLKISLLGDALLRQSIKAGAFLSQGSILMGSRASIEDWKRLGLDAQNYRLKSGLISKEDFEKIFEETDIKKFQKSVHYAHSLKQLEEDEEDQKKKLLEELNEKKGKLDLENNQLESANFNAHFYRIMTSLLLFGVIDALDIVGSACDLMGGDFSESIKEIFGSEKVMGDLAEFYRAIKLDEIAGGLTHIPILKELNQFFVDTLTSEYLSPVTEIGGQMLSSELATLTLGAVLIANRGVNEYNLYDQANKLSEAEIMQIDKMRTHIASTLKNTQKIVSDVYNQKKIVAFSGIKTDLYWDKVDKSEDFAGEFFKKATKHISDKDFGNKLLDENIPIAERIKNLKEYLLKKEKHDDLIGIDRFMQDDFFEHSDLSDQYSQKVSRHYQEQMKKPGIESSVNELIRENQEKIAKTSNEKHKDQLNIEIEFLNRFCFEDRENFVETEMKKNSDYATSIFDRVLTRHYKSDIIFDVKSKTVPTKSPEPLTASALNSSRSSTMGRGQ